MFFKLKTVITENGMYKVSEHKREILYKFCRADFFLLVKTTTATRTQTITNPPRTPPITIGMTDFF